MPDLDFQITGVEPAERAAIPTLAFKLKITGAAEIHNIILRCQIRIEPGRRKIEPSQHEQLRELFGSPDLWGQTMHSMLWTSTTVSIPAFTGQTTLDLPIACTFDFNVATTKYLAAFDAGDIPLTFLFSGTVFYSTENQPLLVEPISWNKEATFRMPVSAWRQMMDQHYPHTAWLCLDRELFNRLRQFKIRNSLMNWDQTLEKLLDGASGGGTSAPLHLVPLHSEA